MKKLGLILGPAMGLGLAWLAFYFLVERKREAVRQTTRLKRKAAQAKRERERAIEAGRKRIEEAKRKKEEAKRKKEGKQEESADAADESAAVAAEEPAAEAPAEEAAAEAPAAEATGPRVAVIEDDTDYARIVSRVLEKSGYRVSVFDRAEAVLKAFASETFDLVLTDIFMEGMGGLEGIKKIRETQSGIKIIAMSAGLDEVSPT